jgi:hypothetical protein
MPLYKCLNILLIVLVQIANKMELQIKLLELTGLFQLNSVLVVPSLYSTLAAPKDCWLLHNSNPSHRAKYCWRGERIHGNVFHFKLLSNDSFPPEHVKIYMCVCVCVWRRYMCARA